jgi:hypothetical protein
MKAELEQKIINPLSGSALADARDFGVDLSLLLERLKLTPEERLRDLQRVMNTLERMRAAKRGADSDKPRSDITSAVE